jgi:hypothetical protein
MYETFLWMNQLYPPFCFIQSTTCSSYLASYRGTFNLLKDLLSFHLGFKLIFAEVSTKLLILMD